MSNDPKTANPRPRIDMTPREYLEYLTRHASQSDSQLGTPLGKADPELRPCKLCGGGAEFVFNEWGASEDDDDGHGRVVCLKCGAEGENDHVGVAIFAWNENASA